MDDYGLFYRNWKGKIFNYLMRMTGDGSLAGDIMQETFVRHFSHYGKVNRDIPLLYRIARNLFLDERRRAKKQPSGEAAEGLEPSLDPDQRLIIRSEYSSVMAAMKLLEPDEREILSLVAGGDLAYAEIATLTGISEANVKVRVHRARLKLRKYMQEAKDE
ncbi:MAG: RNA polymerase sigma factor [Deltaproteobacteria bacterium]|nr:RNA polymerase sigma factor [Deltaproteobacteria bacterium]